MKIKYEDRDVVVVEFNRLEETVVRNALRAYLTRYVTGAQLCVPELVDFIEREVRM